MLESSHRECLDNANARFDRWEAGERATPEEYYEATRYGIATESFGEGPSEYMWGQAKDGPGYTGHVQDAATGLTYMQQRYYDPTIGRFLSVDPVNANSGTGANFNRYWYANNSPYKFTDPDGRIAYLSGNTVYIPVYFTGSGATDSFIDSVVSAASKLQTEDMTRFVVVPVDRVMGGVNVLDVSPGRNRYTTFGSGVIGAPGVIPNSAAHIDSRKGDLARTGLHEILHFARLLDRYKEDPRSTWEHRFYTPPLPGYEGSIMAEVKGNSVRSTETEFLQDAFNGLHGSTEWEKLQERIEQESRSE